MKQFLFTLVLLMSCCLAVSAQWLRKPTPNDTLQSVRVLDNGNVVYSIYAPKAHIVSLAGDKRLRRRSMTMVSGPSRCPTSSRVSIAITL